MQRAEGHHKHARPSALASAPARRGELRYTGQRSQMETIGLYFYRARWYDPYLNRFLSPDSIVPQPGNPLAWDRYSYGFNNPINMVDPSGHKPCSNDGNSFDSCEADTYDKYVIAKKYWTLLPDASETETGVNFPEYNSVVDGKYISYEEHQILKRSRLNSIMKSIGKNCFLVVIPTI